LKIFASRVTFKRLLLFLFLLLFFFFNVALPVRPFWKDKVALSTNLNVHFMCIYVMCVWVDISRAVNFRTPMDLPFALSPILYPFPFSFFNRFFFRRHRIAPPLCLQIAQRKQCENLFVNIHPCLLRFLSSYLLLFIPLVIYVRYTRNGLNTSSRI